MYSYVINVASLFKSFLGIKIIIIYKIKQLKIYLALGTRLAIFQVKQ